MLKSNFFSYFKTGMNQEANGDLVLNDDGADLVRLDQRHVVIQVYMILIIQKIEHHLIKI